MKKYLTPLFTSALLVSCGDLTSGFTSSATTKTADVDVAKIVVTEDPVVIVDKVIPIALPAPTLALSFAPTKAFSFIWAAVPGATSYRLKEAITTSSGYEVITETTDTSFDHIVPLYARLNAKYVLESCNAGGCTASAEVFTSTRITEMVDSIGYLKAHDADANDYFGSSVSLSADGNTLVVGASGSAFSAPSPYYQAWDDDGNALHLGAGAGAVYVFTLDATIWSQQAYLTASNASFGDRFGFSVSLSADGNTLAVGALNEDNNGRGPVDAGAAYVFTRSGDLWSEDAYLKAYNADAGDNFGSSVSLSADGILLAVGARGENSNSREINTGEDDNNANVAGAVYVFTLVETGWSQQAYLKASNADSHDNFGSSVSVSADGNTLAVGAWGESNSAKDINRDQYNNELINAGAVYVFIRTGAVWSQQAYLKASNAGIDNRFGSSVSVSADGNTLAVGALGENSSQYNNDLMYEAGAVYVFIRTFEVWSQQAYLKAGNTGIGDRFGSSVSLSADGNTLAAGAYLEDSDATGINGPQGNGAANSGAVYTFTRSGITWSQKARLKASNTGVNDRFGYSVALSAYGGTLAVGAYGEHSNATGVNGDKDNNDATDSGAVYVY